MMLYLCDHRFPGSWGDDILGEAGVLVSSHPLGIRAEGTCMVDAGRESLMASRIRPSRRERTSRESQSM